MRLIVVLAILSFITWMSSVHAMHVPVSGCCPLVSNTRVHIKRIKNYTIQSEGVCPVTAIVFETMLGTRICSDPESNWAKKAKVKVDEEAKGLLEMEQNAQASTSDSTSTVPTTTKKAKVKVDEEAKGLLEMEQNTQASTSDSTSTVPTTTKKVPVKKGRKGRRRRLRKTFRRVRRQRLRKKFRRVRRWQRKGV
ncbi:lymphotactin-like isoform X2 [Hippoglossus stenolepis]|uniref:lymphotactin-like isoform X2 n=1 Tax=Hippoglossus stenolepis TaxID=195615 RepID=UPI001FAF6B99|nr:lymphotactin-like isoform X2 [Hippoglossus stenolepis]